MRSILVKPSALHVGDVILNDRTLEPCSTVLEVRADGFSVELAQTGVFVDYDHADWLGVTDVITVAREVRDDAERAVSIAEIAASMVACDAESEANMAEIAATMADDDAPAPWILCREGEHNVPADQAERDGSDWICFEHLEGRELDAPAPRVSLVKRYAGRAFGTLAAVAMVGAVAVLPGTAPAEPRCSAVPTGTACAEPGFSLSLEG
jgi:hypothetical protein